MLWRRVDKGRNARKQSRTSARAAKLAIGEMTRARVKLEVERDPSATVSAIARRVNRDAATVRRARKSRR